MVNEPTLIAKSSSTLIDLIPKTNFQNVNAHGVVDTPDISDHCLIFMVYSFRKPNSKPRSDFRSFDEAPFVRGMLCAPWGNILSIDDDIDKNITTFENILNEIIDKYATCRSFRVTRPCLIGDIKRQMNNRNKFKNKFKVYRYPETEQIYKTRRNNISHSMRNAKIKIFNERIIQNLKMLGSLTTPEKPWYC